MFYIPTLTALELDGLYSDQARSQGGFEGVRTNPPCSLAKFIFNEAAAVQGSLGTGSDRRPD